jgi:tetratricopeptide (TPR) repeat protein
MGTVRTQKILALVMGLLFVSQAAGVRAQEEAARDDVTIPQDDPPIDDILFADDVSLDGAAPEQVAEESEEAEVLLAANSTAAAAKKKKKSKKTAVKKLPPALPKKKVTEKIPLPKAATMPAPVPVAKPKSEAAQARSTPQAQQLFQEARRAYRKKKYKDSVELAHQALGLVSTRDERNRLRIVKGLGLYKLGLSAAALEQFLAVAQNDPGARDLRSSVANAIVSSRIINAEESLIPVFSSYSPSAFQQESRFSLFYRLGKAYLRQRNPAKAVDYLRHVPGGSVDYLDSLLLQGIAYNEMKQRTQAYAAFKKILDAGIRSHRDQVVWELANLNAARVAFALQDHLRAVEHYQRVPRSSAFWLDALFEASWPLFHLDDYNLALGYLKTIHSPYFVVKYYPESLILRSIVLFRLCKYSDMRKTIAFYRREYASYPKLFSDYLREKGDDKKAYFDDVLAYLSEEHGDPGAIPGRVWDWVISDVYFKELDQTWRRLGEEREKARRLNFSQNQLAQQVEHAVDVHFAKTQSEINVFVRQKIGRALNQLRALDDQLNILELEQTLGEKQAIEEQKAPHRESQLSISVSVPSGYEFWPFTGEYWKDELGFYAYSTGDSCGIE